MQFQPPQQPPGWPLLEQPAYYPPMESGQPQQSFTNYPQVAQVPPPPTDPFTMPPQQQMQSWKSPQPQYAPQPYYPSQYPQQWPPQPYYPPPQLYYPSPIPQQIVVNQSVNVTGSFMSKQQFSPFIRLLYFLFIGWWVGISWACIALLFCATIIGLPIGLVMLHYLPTVLTLQQ